MEEEVKQFGIQMSEVFSQIESAIMERESAGLRPMYTSDGFRAITHIFMSGMVDKFFEKCLRDKESQESAEKLVEQMGGELKDFIMKWTDIDTHKLFE